MRLTAFLIAIIVCLISCKQRIELNGSYTCLTDQLPSNSKNSELLSLAKIFSGDKPIYSELIFKGSNTVVVKSFDVEFSTSYEIDSDYLKIKTDKSDLLFKIANENTLIGEGFAIGLYRKKQEGDDDKYIAISPMAVREKPDANSKIIGTIPIGNTFLLAVKMKDWIQIFDGHTSGFTLNQFYLSLNREIIESDSQKSLKQKNRMNLRKPMKLREG